MALDIGKISVVVLSYWVISISMLFTNKYLVGNRDDSIDVSLFIAWVQCCITVVFVVAMKAGRSLFHFRRPDWSKLLSRQQFMELFHSCAQLKWLTVSYVGLLSFNNLCLKHVGVAFFQVARSMTLIFTVIFSVTLLKKPISFKILLCCLVVAGGFILGVDQESVVGTLSVRGVLYGVTTSLFVAMNGILIKKSLVYVDHNSTKLTFYNNINAAIVLFPFVLFTGQINGVIASERLKDSIFWLFLLATGILGFLIAWISAIQIDVTSPVTHHISANTKSVLQTFIAVLLYHQTKPALWWGSIALVAIGATMYAMVRIREEKAEKESVVVSSKDIEAQMNGTLKNGHVTLTLDEKSKVDGEGVNGKPKGIC